ncbi:hypothetical protein ACFQO9_09395 [Chryseobacterium zhengzhouense]|uniref:Uncharacterized protein n=1 Tax=Chryseobacterium zhengzhouense TaxID=1636086 RepID=A0ABW2LWH8_9FLAO
MNDETSLARKISQKHPNTLVVGFDGYVTYGRDRISRKGTITTIDNSIDYRDALGMAVFYKNGIEINRMFYNQFKLLQEKTYPGSGGL